MITRMTSNNDNHYFFGNHRAKKQFNCFVKGQAEYYFKTSRNTPISIHLYMNHKSDVKVGLNKTADIKKITHKRETKLMTYVTLSTNLLTFTYVDEISEFEYIQLIRELESIEIANKATANLNKVLNFAPVKMDNNISTFEDIVKMTIGNFSQEFAKSVIDTNYGIVVSMVKINGDEVRAYENYGVFIYSINRNEVDKETLNPYQVNLIIINYIDCCIERIGEAEKHKQPNHLINDLNKLIAKYKEAQ